LDQVLDSNVPNLKRPDYYFSEIGSATLATQSSDSFSKFTRTLPFMGGQYWALVGTRLPSYWCGEKELEQLPRAVELVVIQSEDNLMVYA
jgi:hypothetical protein